MREIIAIGFVGLALLGMGYFGHAVLTPAPQAVEASAIADRELVATGMTIINVLPGAKVIAYPGGDFVIDAPDGGVTVVQMPTLAQSSKLKAQRKKQTGLTGSTGWEQSWKKR